MLRSSLVALLGLALAASLPGCFARVLDVGSTDAGAAAPSSSSTAIVDAGPPSLVNHGPPYDPSTVKSFAALCTSPHGPLDTAETVGAVQGKLTGAWYLCSTSDPAVDTVKSMEFTASGTWYNLVDDGHGGLVRAQGIDSQGTYAVTDTNDEPDAAPDAATSSFVPRYRGSGMFPDFVHFESAPRRMQISEGTSGFIEWFIYLGPSTQP